MRLEVCALLVAFTLPVSADNPADSLSSRAKAISPPAATAPGAPLVKDLPVRKVVLYKNGVGYFEHAGSVTGNESVAIDFTSPQLNDVLQSLTVLDEGGGRIAGIDYNSTTPIGEQLNKLALGLNDYPATLAVYHALRGQHVEVTGSGAPLTGRLVNIEFRKETDKNGATSEDRYFLIVASDSGALRTAELSDSVSVRMLDPALQKQFNEYLEIIASAQEQQVRRLTLEDRGEGQRQLSVSYISEIPVWKSTYRIVFPREPDGKAIVQGWAVVDNTVGADWDNVQLSLVAGAPQSFIQPLSQPLYARRPEIPIATNAETTPQTHEAANMPQLQSVGNRDVPTSAAARERTFISAAPGAASQTVTVDAEAKTDSNGVFHGLGSRAANGSGAEFGGSGGGVYRPSDTISAGDVSTSAFDDFFEYALAQPVTIHKNESAMVPILQQELPAEHVTLWSENGGGPLRAVWLDNPSKLTLDAGSFSVFENGEFAGEGLLDPIHPGERRLLSYAADQAVKIKVVDRTGDQRLSHLHITKGAIVETWMNIAGVTYSANNTGDEDRTVLVEHPRHSGSSGWTLDGDLKAAEETPNLYRFRMQVPAHSTQKLEVRERGPEYTTVDLNQNPRQEEFLLDLVKRVPDAQAKIQPVIDAESALTALDEKIAAQKKTEETAAADETRDRDNLTALKGNEAARRFVDELNRAEDLLQATRKQIADLEQQKAGATAKLYDLINSLSFDWSEMAK